VSSPGQRRAPTASASPPAVTEADRANAEVAASEYNRYITRFLPQAARSAAAFRDDSLVGAVTRGVVERDSAVDTREFNRRAASAVTAATGQRALGSAGRSGVRRAHSGVGGMVSAAAERKYKGLSALAGIGEGLSGTALQGSRALGQLAAETSRVNTRQQIQDIEDRFVAGESLRSAVMSGLGGYAAFRTRNQTDAPVPTLTGAGLRAQIDDITNRAMGRGVPLMLRRAGN